ncbi:MAG: restriction endonuclease [Deltaproteobacteria bacterium]|nr:restriction endonuclease [Deltaproteobacteria bacterium]
MPNGLDFERQVHALLKKMGFEADVTKASGDGGIDIIAHSKEHITGGKYIIQCKDWSNPVGEPPVRDLYGVVTAEKANKGILITTSTFTSPAIKFAEDKPLELIDGAKFNKLLSKYGLAGIKGESHPAPDDERIKDLTDKLNKNPKNILVMKELADIYLRRRLYDKAVVLYESLIPLKPSIEIERLNKAWTSGLNNYGVALACLKRYDEAIKIFQDLCRDHFHSPVNEAYLTHYLGLYNIAIQLYEELKSEVDNSDYKKFCDDRIEKAYMEEQMDIPFLALCVDETVPNAKPELRNIPLEIARQKAVSEELTKLIKQRDERYQTRHEHMHSSTLDCEQESEECEDGGEKAEAKWEEIINKEKAEWREKLHNTLYANWSPKSNNSKNTQQNKQCFIATAVYGSPFSPEVEALRQWRDNSLYKIPLGRSLISTYYKYSPRIADYIKHRPVIKGAIKKALNGVVWMVRRKER